MSARSTCYSWIIFLPAICLYPLWITIGLRDDLITSSVSSFYPMMIAMVIGSMIAGATPLGGGVVGFPVSVLILGFSPKQGRDFSLLIQSVGMVAASFLILYKKNHLLEEFDYFLGKSIVLSLVGLILGFEMLAGVSPFVVNIVYTTTVACVAVVFAYQDFYAKCKSRRTASLPLAESNAFRSHGESASPNEKSQMEVRVVLNLLEFLCFPLFSIAGGLLSSQIGSGADVACYLYGSLSSTITSHPRYGAKNKCCENTLTSASVIVMACTSVFGSILRLTASQDSEDEVDAKVLLAVFACSPIVVLGAPVGSLFLKPENKQRLKCIFYALGVLQLLIFGAIKIGSNMWAWAIISALMVTLLCALCTHYILSSGVCVKNVEVETVDLNSA